MTFRQDDLEQAVEDGLITEAQALGIARIATARRQYRAFAAGREERFRMLGGFNDFFVATGVALLGIGLALAANSAGKGTLDGAAWTVAFLVMWAVAEVLTARLRLTAPSIVAVLCLGGFAFGAARAFLMAFGMDSDGANIIANFVASGMLVLHYLRFRLPFTLLPLALFGAFLFISITGGLVSGLLESTTVTKDAIMWWTVFAYGLVVFALAMRFDVTDPERLTTRSDCGFWLHMIAAPMLVHPLVAPLFSGLGTNQFGFSAFGYALMALFTITLATVALIIDRRALLLSGLSYIGIVISYAVTQLSGGKEALMFVTPLSLGIFVIMLGVGWRRLRARLMTTIPDYSWKHVLPPYQTAKTQ